MDINGIKLIYSVKYNQFFEPMRMDEDVGVVYMKPTKNRHDGITKSQILCVEKTTDVRFVVMYNTKETAEEHFFTVINSGENLNAMRGEIDSFKKHMLPESERAMQKLKEISEMDSAISKSAKVVYDSLMRGKVLKENRNTYIGQIVPDEIKRLAWQKRLFIERSDDYCGKLKKRRTSNDERYAIQGCYPCGFLIRDRGGNVVCGGRYGLSVQDVTEFVQQYKNDERKHYERLYYPPLDKEQKEQIKRCCRILERNNLYHINKHNCYFWVANSEKQIIAGGKSGFNLKGLVRFCKKLNRKGVTDRVQISN